MSLPISLVVYHLEGVSKKDAMAAARGYVERNITSLDEAYTSVRRYGQGYLVEIQEGGEGESYLPALVAHLDARPEGEEAVIDLAGRQAVFTREFGKINSLLLPESAERRPVTKEIVPGGRMMPYRGEARYVFTAGAVIAGIGAAIFIGTSLVLQVKDILYDHAIDPERLGVLETLYRAEAGSEGQAELIERQYGIDRLPISQQQALYDAAKDSTYVKSLRYYNGGWHIETAQDKAHETNRRMGGIERYEEPGADETLSAEDEA